MRVLLDGNGLCFTLRAFVLFVHRLIHRRTMRTWAQYTPGQSVQKSVHRVTTAHNCAPSVEPNLPFPCMTRRQAISGAIALSASSWLTFSATATGLEAIDLPVSSLRTVDNARMQENRGRPFHLTTYDGTTHRRSV